MKKYLKVFGIVSGISGILLIGVITAYFLLNRYPLSNATGETKNLKKEELLAYDKFYEGIFINDIDLKGLTKEEKKLDYDYERDDRDDKKLSFLGEY